MCIRDRAKSSPRVVHFDKLKKYVGGTPRSWMMVEPKFLAHGETMVSSQSVSVAASGDTMVSPRETVDKRIVKAAEGETTVKSAESETMSGLVAGDAMVSPGETVTELVTGDTMVSPSKKHGETVSPNVLSTPLRRSRRKVNRPARYRSTERRGKCVAKREVC